MIARVDVVVIGGGIAGLWILASLRESGYSALLLESSALGAGQTVRSQGIIHGGTKYSLQGAITRAASAVAAMPAAWRRALAGAAPVDLRRARVLSRGQLLWSTEAPAPRIAAFLASKVMRARVRALEQDALPAPFAGSAFRGRVYRLEEPVVDVSSVLQALQRRYRASLLLTAADTAERLAPREGLLGLRVRSAAGVTLEIRAQRAVLCAAAGNVALGKQLGGTVIECQRRPLKMVLIRGQLPALYGHAMGVSSVPRLTVTTHRDAAGRRVWYVGGGLAENGVGLDRQAQLQTARDELRATLPWIDQQGLQWATLDVDRVEARQAGGKRPDSVVLDARGPITAAWPTKLALTPALAERYLAQLRHEGLRPLPKQHVAAPEAWSRPEVAARPWDEALQWT